MKELCLGSGIERLVMDVPLATNSGADSGGWAACCFGVILDYNHCMRLTLGNPAHSWVAHGLFCHASAHLLLAMAPRATPDLPAAS